MKKRETEDSEVKPIPAVTAKWYENTTISDHTFMVKAQKAPRVRLNPQEYTVGTLFALLKAPHRPYGLLKGYKKKDKDPTDPRLYTVVNISSQSLGVKYQYSELMHFFHLIRPYVEELNISANNLSSLPSITFPNLISLNVSSNPLPPGSKLPKMPKLCSLNVSDTFLSIDDMKEIKSKCPKLQRLVARDTKFELLGSSVSTKLKKLITFNGQSCAFLRDKDEKPSKKSEIETSRSTLPTDQPKVGELASVIAIQPVE
ncbi:hypothetical protein ADUPG1_012776 [Aduncisulcus paluster]|uniref:Uncharacterized protein n=1 Tax=Aduncisulcus paluster TaxID=2918883 RepID=A0ABQ5K5F6_9EUKA|nr:hypothetical protein ADUPG1_012776 [Aduncisulcus paluster]